MIFQCQLIYIFFSINYRNSTEILTFRKIAASKHRFNWRASHRRCVHRRNLQVGIVLLDDVPKNKIAHEKIMGYSILAPFAPLALKTLQRLEGKGKQSLRTYNSDNTATSCAMSASRGACRVPKHRLHSGCLWR